ncbi:auxin response factor 1-like isoform X2 [Cryptomeria japonica]|uniref:auxin response factor 1-like isoform X2 n=1 Tax=Cryptomeria japonica TaxID=3369 RepID=UPI0027D9DE9B|nr:auxin response factor 1-like isoform X2 [Cryptomeria japonica]
MAAGPRTPSDSSCCTDVSDPLYEELWHACAGPRVTVPRIGERVFYFPQGHIEQVEASTNQEAEKQLPLYDLPSKILCRVKNMLLQAEPDTDEVFANVSLVPEAEDECSTDMDPPPPPPARPSVHSFCKTLTASDTTNGGFLCFPKKYAEECLGPLDMSQQPPTQEIVARDLHGNNWSFRHIYRGGARTHLLSTGWNAFVRSKRLLPGDAFIFLRGENGQLRVGIRRAMGQHSNIPSSVMSSHSMQLGVLATASHAISTRTVFSVLYKPRTGPSEFIIPYDQYMEAMSSNLSVGMRFKMRFEEEAAPEQRSTGTIIKIGDSDPMRWPDSKWRCLKVQWDAIITSAIPRAERVSPWKIEPALTPSKINPSQTAKKKRPRPNILPSNQDLSLNDKASIDFTQLQRFDTRVLQGQDVMTLGGSLGENEVDNVPRKVVCVPKLDDVKTKVVCSQGRLTSESWIPLQRHDSVYRGCFPSFQGIGVMQELCGPYTNRIVENSQGMKVSRNPLEELSESNQKQYLTLMAPSRKPSGNMRWNGFNGYPNLSNMGMEALGKWKMHMMPCHSEVSGGNDSVSKNLLRNMQANKQGTKEHQPGSVSREASKDKGVEVISLLANNNCKLSGLHLTDIFSGSKPNPSKNRVSVNEEDLQVSAHTQKEFLLQFSEVDQRLEPTRLIRSDTSAISCEQETASWRPLQETQSRAEINTTRSCTKVHKQGSALGRALDLKKFEGYKELIHELDLMFNFKGQLEDPRKGWQVVYTDDEGDMMLVGDDPWQEFCSVVRKIFIYTREEVEKMTPRSLELKRKFEEPISSDISTLAATNARHT